MVLRLLFIFLILGFAAGAWAGEAPAQMDLEQTIRGEIAKKFPEARVQLTSSIHMNQGSLDAGQIITIQTITSRGEAVFGSPTGSGWVSFAAWVPAQVALKRIQPGEKLTADEFVAQEVNIATGNAAEYRGVILGPETPVTGLESRQTILEGQFLLSTAAQKIPDLRRGDTVRIQLISGGLTISTLGNAEEPAYVNGRVHVLASKTKREFVGNLLPGGVVEVRL